MRALSMVEISLIGDRITVALFRQEQLAMVGEVEFDGVARDQGVEQRGLAASLGAQDPAEALSLLLARAKGAGHLNQHVGVRQVNGEVADLGENQLRDLASTEAPIKVLALGITGLS